MSDQELVLRTSAFTGDPELDKKLHTGEVIDTSGVSPGAIRYRLEKIKAAMSSLEADLQGPINKGVEKLREVSFEIAEACDDINRAVELLDKNYQTMS